MMKRQRLVAWPACYNIRDLGGLPLPFGGRTRFGELLRADNLDRLTAEGWASAVGYGVKTVVDLRSPRELAGHTQRPADVKAVQVSILDQDDTRTLTELYQAGSTEESYAIMLSRCSIQFGAALRTIAHADRAVVVHCQAGRDRTGLVSALVLGIAGAGSATIALDYELSEVQLRPLYEELAANAPNEQQRALLVHENRASKEANSVRNTRGALLASWSATAASAKSSRSSSASR